MNVFCPVRTGLLVAIGLILPGIIAPMALADDGESRKPSYSLEPEAEKFVEAVPRADWLKDEVFVAKLKELAASDLSAQAKADAFTLMQRKLGWLFLGVSRLFPGQGYAQSTSGVLSTYFRYQQQMPEDLDVAPLLELARVGRKEHPLRPSNALMLAVLLNRKAAKDAVVKAIDFDAIGSAKVPAIDLHNLCLSATLSLDPEVVEKLFDLLPRITSEESREDIIVSTVIYDSEALRDRVEAFVKAEFPGRFDRGVTTALQVLAHRGPVEHFRNFYKGLGELPKVGKEDVAKLRKFWDDGFRDGLEGDRPGGSMLKVWDGFTVVVENDGQIVRYEKVFQDYLPNEKPPEP